MGSFIGRANKANEINNLLEGIKTSLYSLYNKILCNGLINSAVFSFSAALSIIKKCFQNW